MPDDRRLQRIEELYYEAVDWPVDQRSALLRRACAEDTGLLQEVESLLAVRNEANLFFQAPERTLAAATSPPEDGVLGCGERLQHYQIIRLLGKGGMGEVYLAEDTRLQRRIALKILPAQFTRDAERARRFGREARAISLLNHPHILTIHELGQTPGGAHFLVTEYVEGQNLRQLLDERGPLPLREAIQLATQIAEALTAAHAAGIIHRDIKPENVMVRRDGHVKVLDFGLAKIAEAPLRANADSFSETGKIIGTLSYMSPEQARGLNVDARTDIFSLGVVLYEMLAGRLPFAGATPSDRLAALLCAEPPPLAQLTAALPSALTQLVETALAKECDARQPTASELARALKQLTEELAFQSRLADDNQYQAAAKARQTSGAIVSAPPTQVPRRWLMTIAALLLVCLTLWTTWRLWPSQSVTSTPGLSQAPGKTLAILPFSNLTGDAAQEFFTDGLAEDLTNDLARLKDLTVIARHSAFTFKGQPVDVRAAGRKLNVAAILVGNVQRQGERWQITATLHETQTGRELWRSESESHQLENLFDIQQKIRCNVAANLQAILCSDDVDKPQTHNLEAYLAYLKGLYHFNRRTSTSLKQAIAHFEQAVKFDPHYASAWAALADAYFVGKWYIPLSNEVLPKIKATAQRAIALDDSLAYAHFVMAQYWSTEGNMAESERETAKLWALTPNFLRSLHSLGITRELEGKSDEGLRLMKKAQQLDPLSLVINTDVGYVCYIARRYDEAIANYRGALALEPKFSLAHLLLGLALTQQGRHAEAIAEVQQATERGSEYLAALGNVYARAGQRREALATLDQLQQLARRQYVPPYQFAWIYCGLGDLERAVASLQKSMQEKTGVIDFKHHPVYEPLRGDARYEELLHQAPYSW